MKKANAEFIKLLEENYVCTSFSCGEIINAFNKPILVMLGRQDNCVGYRDAEKIFKDSARASVIILDSVGHNMQIECPKVFNALMNEWLSNFKTYNY